MNVCKLGLSIAMLLSGGMAFAQGTVDDYNRAYALREKFSANKVFYSSVTPQWIEGTHQFWYVRNTPEGRIYVSVNADKKNRKELFDHKRLASALSNASGKEVKPEAIQLERLRVNPSLDTLRFVFGNQRWMYATRKNQLVNEGALPDRNAPQKHWMERDDEKEAAPVTSPDGKYTAYIKNQNVYVKELATGKEKQLSLDGTLSNYYSVYIRWSPDSKKVASCKICDQISDAVLDALMEQDPMSRVACETSITTGLVLVMGEITTNAYVDIQKIVRETIREIGYDRAKYGFDCDTCGVITAIDEQSSDIAMGVDKALEAKEHLMSEDDIEAIGAGDQGMMFGFATNETPEYMPYPIALAHKLARKLTEVRKNGTLPYLRPDGKTQVTVEYDENDKPVRLDAVVLSTQHGEEVSQEQIHADVKKYIFDEVLPQELIDENTKFFINPTGRFVIGGPNGDSGLTGRKIIVDTYGGYARHGGGAFSGKDCTKVDRSAAYAARYVAKNIVAAGLADKCEIQLSYAIGVARPTSIMVDTFGTGKLSDEKLVEIIREHFDLRPAGIIKMLDLRRPIYKQTAAYGHFGRTDLDLPWEKLDKVDVLKAYL